MEKINFKNLPDTSTPINAENLNGLQNNIETSINGVILYNNPIGNPGAFTLSDTIANYTFLKIFYYDINVRLGSVEVLATNDRDIDISSFQSTTGNARLLNRVIHIKDKSVTNVAQGYVAFDSNTRINSDDMIAITKIIGYK